MKNDTNEFHGNGPKKFVLGQEFSNDITSTPNNTKKMAVLLEDTVALNIPFKFPADAFQTPKIGVEHCGVKLRQVDNGSDFPELMLVHFLGYFKNTFRK